MLTYILPVALFVVTLVIILALRAEDKKSRSLQTVKEKISMFRSESQQTMARINETAKDATERVDAKKREALDMIGSLDASLQNLSNHRNDLSGLEAVCRGYELALDKLRVQTEHAEDRIRLVQGEVEKAGQVETLIQHFHQEVEGLEQELNMLTQRCHDLVASTSDELARVAEEHRKKADDMLLSFSDALSQNREQFGVFIDDVKEDLDRRHEDFKSYLGQAFSDLDGKRTEVETACTASMEEFSRSREELRTASEESAKNLGELRTSLEDFGGELKETLAADRTALDEAFSSALAEAGERFDSMNQSLGKAAEAIRTSVDSARAGLEDRAGAIKAELDSYKESLDASLEDEKGRIEAGCGAAVREADEHFESLRSALTGTGEEITRQTDQCRSEMDETLASISRTLDESRQKLDEMAASHGQSVEEIRRQSLEVAGKEFSSLADQLGSTASQLGVRIQDERSALDAALKARRGEMDDYLRTLDERIELLEGRRNEIAAQAESLKSASDETYDAFRERIGELSSASQTSFASTLRTGEDNLTKLADELRNRFESDSGAVFARLEGASDDFSRLHQTQKERIEAEEEEYIAKCRSELAGALDAEVARVSKVFDDMMSSSTQQLGNFARKLTEIKEAVSMLNQGVNESLARTGEKLGQIQNRMAASEATLAETQNKVTVAKEELFNLQKEHKSIQDEVGKAQKELEWLQGKAQNAKRERQNEEARLVKLQMERKSRVDQDKAPADDFVGEEEEIPIDEE